MAKQLIPTPAPSTFAVKADSIGKWWILGCDFDVAVQQSSKLEVEDHGLGIYLPAPGPALANERAGVRRLLAHQRLQPVPKLFDAP
jgi:hypothetical protein